MYIVVILRQDIKARPQVKVFSFLDHCVFIFVFRAKSDKKHHARFRKWLLELNWTWHSVCSLKVCVCGSPFDPDLSPLLALFFALKSLNIY